MLSTLVALLLASVLIVPVSRGLGFGSVLGYLVGGALIGPALLGLVSGVGQIEAVSELGVVMLLFLIGLELRPARLWTLRRSVFGLGAAQLLCCASVLAAAIHLCAGLGWAAALALGLGLALSSTAIVLPMLGERGLLDGRAGRDGFAVLLFQDLSFIPLVALVPLLGIAHPRALSALQAGTLLQATLPWRAVGLGLGAIGLILLGGLVLLPRLFRLIGGARTPESFTALALLTVALSAWLAQAAGLSMSLGAFLAGVLLSNSEYRHELEADIAPFEGLLLGFFFMSVGMSAHLSLLAAEPLRIAGDVLLLIGVKIAICFGLGRIARQTTADALRFALALPQGSEFSFVLFAAAVAAGTLPDAMAAEATLAVALSMAATPILFAASESFLLPHLISAKNRQAPVYDQVPLQDAPVIICGFGRMGQIVGRVLRTQNIGFTALEQDATQVEVIRRFGAQVFYGDPARAEMLRAAGADTAKLLVVALADPDDVLRVVDVAQRHFPELRVLARVRNRKHAHLLMERDVPLMVRETFASALEMTGIVLAELGIGENARAQILSTFRAHDEAALRASLSFRDDEKRLIQTSQQLNDELTALFAGDRKG